MKFLRFASKALNFLKNNDNNEEINEANDKEKKNLKLVLILVGFSFFIFPLFFVIIFLIANGDIDGDFSSKNGLSYNSSLRYDSSCDFEATTVVVMDAANTRVLATVSLEDYVIGVGCVEIGACGGSSSSINEHYVKSQYMAAKTYVLERGHYNMSDKSIKVRASNADQVWCDLKKGCYQGEKVEINGRFYSAYYPGDSKHPAKWKFTEEDLETFHKWYQEIYGLLFIRDGYKDKIERMPVDSVGLQYKDSTQKFWNYMAGQGYTYDKILVATSNPSLYSYDKTVADTNSYLGRSVYSLSVACPVVSRGSGYAALDSYPLKGDGAVSLSSPITSVLSNSQIDKINRGIVDAVDEAGRGTGAGVAAAGTALIMGLYNEGYFLPYYWGGKYNGLGLNLKWGEYNPSSASTGGHVYDYLSMDCSGFVAWSIVNGACPNFKKSSYLYQGGKLLNSYSEFTPGDIISKKDKSNYHIILLLKNNGDGTYITAESTVTGVIFNMYSDSYFERNGYEGYDMDDFYKNGCS